MDLRWYLTGVLWFRPLNVDSRGEAFIVRQILAPSIRQSLFTPLEEAVDTNEYDPAADPPLHLRACVDHTAIGTNHK